VASMTGEIGIRLALGAQPSNVMRLVLGRATIAATFGVAAGLAGAIALRKAIATQLIGVGAADPVVLGSVAVVLFGTALLAGWLPAIQASRIDPAETLRTE
jgi:putative ABC transport system permease protein